MASGDRPGAAHLALAGEVTHKVRGIVSTDEGVYEIPEDDDMGHDEITTQAILARKAMTEANVNMQVIFEPELDDFFNPVLPKPLQEVSIKFYDIAQWMFENLPPSAQRAQGLWDLLRAKDCAVRARKRALDAAQKKVVSHRESCKRDSGAHHTCDDGTMWDPRQWDNVGSA